MISCFGDPHQGGRYSDQLFMVLYTIVLVRIPPEVRFALYSTGTGSAYSRKNSTSSCSRKNPGIRKVPKKLQKCQLLFRSVTQATFDNCYFLNLLLIRSVTFKPLIKSKYNQS